jgi:hypothetical protein
MAKKRVTGHIPGPQEESTQVISRKVSSMAWEEFFNTTRIGITKENSVRGRNMDMV